MAEGHRRVDVDRARAGDRDATVGVQREAGCSQPNVPPESVSWLAHWERRWRAQSAVGGDAQDAGARHGLTRVCVRSGEDERAGAGLGQVAGAGDNARVGERPAPCPPESVPLPVNAMPRLASSVKEALASSVPPPKVSCPGVRNAGSRAQAGIRADADRAGGDRGRAAVGVHSAQEQCSVSYLGEPVKAPAMAPVIGQWSRWCCCSRGLLPSSAMPRLLFSVPYAGGHLERPTGQREVTRGRRGRGASVPRLASELTDTVPELMGGAARERVAAGERQRARAALHQRIVPAPLLITPE